MDDRQGIDRLMAGKAASAQYAGSGGYDIAAVVCL